MKLSELIGRDISLSRKGQSDRYWTWTDHDSFVVDNEKGRWQWYSRDLWGDYVDWLQERGLSLKDAIEQSKKIQVDQGVCEPAKLLERKILNAQTRVDFQKCQNYLKSRGVTRETATRFRLGFHNSGAIYLPNYGPDGKLIACRIRFIQPLDSPSGRPTRYLSVEGSRYWYPYGLWTIPKSGNVLFVAEGEFKVMILHQLGCSAIGTQGSAFRKSWLEYLQGWDRIVYLRDSGEAPGLLSALRFKELCPRAEIESTYPHKSIDDSYLANSLATLQFIQQIKENTNVRPRTQTSPGANVPQRILGEVGSEPPGP
jgi:hypothetical protein